MLCEQDLVGMVGHRCWHVSAGGATSPSFLLAFGEQMPREVPLRNQAQPESFRLNRGSIELLVWSSWRVLRDGELAATSDQDDITAIIELFTGAVVTAVECRPPLRDLRIAIGDHVLETFSDRERGETNWELWIGGRHLAG